MHTEHTASEECMASLQPGLTDGLTVPSIAVQHTAKKMHQESLCPTLQIRPLKCELQARQSLLRVAVRSQLCDQRVLLHRFKTPDSGLLQAVAYLVGEGA